MPSHSISISHHVLISILLVGLPLLMGSGDEPPRPILTRMEVVGATTDGKICMHAEALDVFDPVHELSEVASKEGWFALGKTALITREVGLIDDEHASPCDLSKISKTFQGKAWLKSNKGEKFELVNGEVPEPDELSEDDTDDERSCVSCATQMKGRVTAMLELDGKTYKIGTLFSGTTRTVDMSMTGTKEHVLVTLYAEYSVASMCPNEEHIRTVLIDRKRKKMHPIYHGYGNEYGFREVDRIDPLNELRIDSYDSEHLASPSKHFKRHRKSMRVIEFGLADTTPKFFAYFKSLRSPGSDEPDFEEVSPEVELTDEKKKSFKRKSTDAGVERFEDKKHRKY